MLFCTSSRAPMDSVRLHAHSLRNFAMDQWNKDMLNWKMILVHSLKRVSYVFCMLMTRSLPEPSVPSWKRNPPTWLQQVGKTTHVSTLRQRRSWSLLGNSNYKNWSLQVSTGTSWSGCKGAGSSKHD
jgi:hypothetical protein